ncbi:MAG: DUF6599 family protein [Desulfobaccales bacterium]|jgi:hypothetical protein
MAPRKATVSAAQKLTGYGIIAMLGLITIWLLFQQTRFNPAVLIDLRPPLPPAKAEALSGQALAATAALLPEVPGFKPLAPIESYGPETLSDKIDGKADLYLPAGFKEMSCRKFNLDTAADKAFVEVFIYDMGSAANAFAVFSGQRRPGSPNLPLTANAYTTGNALFFTQGRYYLEIVADRTSKTLSGSLSTYATAILAKIPSPAGQAKGEQANPALLFPKEGLAPDSVRLLAADVFSMEGFNNVLTGEYHLKSGNATAFIARRATPEAATAEARRYLDFLAANGYRKVQAPAAAGDISVLALDNSFEVVWVQGRIMAGVHDAASVEAALDLAGELRPALEEKKP